jgi:hypothetical protein
MSESHGMTIKTFFQALFAKIKAFFLCFTTEAEQETDAIVETIAEIVETVDPKLKPGMDLAVSEAKMITRACEREGTLLRTRTIKHSKTLQVPILIVTPPQDAS